MVLCAKLIDNGASRHIEYIQYVLDDNTVDQIEILDSAAHLLYTTCLFTCRLSALAFYARLAFSYSKLQLAIKIAAGFLFAAFLPQMCVIIFHCRPVTFLWPFSFQVAEMSGYKCATWGPPYLVNSALSLLCDLLIFTIPAVLIKVLDIDRKKKIQLMLILFPGILWVFAYTFLFPQSSFLLFLSHPVVRSYHNGNLLLSCVALLFSVYD